MPDALATTLLPEASRTGVHWLPFHQNRLAFGVRFWKTTWRLLVLLTSLLLSMRRPKYAPRRAEAGGRRGLVLRRTVRVPSKPLAAAVSCSLPVAEVGVVATVTGPLVLLTTTLWELVKESLGAVMKRALVDERQGVIASRGQRALADGVAADGFAGVARQAAAEAGAVDKVAAGELVGQGRVAGPDGLSLGGRGDGDGARAMVKLVWVVCGRVVSSKTVPLPLAPPP